MRAALSEPDLRLPMWLAMAGTSSMIAHQVAAKAARDGFFLQQFEPTDLPKMVVVAALLSFALALLFSRGSERLGPARLVPLSFAVSAVLHLVEWIAMPQAPRAVVVIVYLHVVGLGAILLSGFWLLLSEVFDLREAKKRFGRIAGIGTVGGIAGGLMAERMVAWSLSEHLLLLLAILHVGCAAISFRLRPPVRRATRPSPAVTARAAFARTPLLWQLAALVFLGTCTAAILDYLFKLGATLSMGKGPMLVRYFAYYYTACQILTFLLQTFLAKPAVERLGIAKSVASLPVAVGLGSTVALLIPVYPLVIGLRATEVILRGSLFRSGYEFLYTPVPPADKRAVKTIVDVGFDRMGDAAGAGAVQLMVWLGPALARPEILGLAMVLTAISTTLALRLEASYRGVLERGLVERAREDEDEDAGQDSLMNTVFDGLPSVHSFQSAGRKQAPAKAPAPAAEQPAARDAATELMADLRSRDERKVVRALTSQEPWDPLVIPQVIRLLAWDEVSASARKYLERGGTRIQGQIIDALTDETLDYGIRRRLPRLLARLGDQVSVDGLVRALDDPRFEIRYQCGRALDHLKRQHEELDFRPAKAMAAAGRELMVNQSIWGSRRRMELKDSSSDGYDFLDEVLRDRADRSLEHVFSLFAVVLPREPLMAAFRALHQDDKMFRALALEYLENTLPEDIRKRLWVVIEESPPAHTGQDSQAVLDALLETNASMLLQLRKSAHGSEDHAPVLAAERGSDPKPDQRQGDIEPGEAR
ncbi:MAG: hypothetical protein ACKV2U_14320 [Bryobacteraceae bacterium]